MRITDRVCVLSADNSWSRLSWLIVDLVLVPVLAPLLPLAVTV